MNRRYALLATTLLAASSWGAEASADTARPSTVIEELVVTAEKREQNLQDVPTAVSAFTAERRELIGITSVQDITNYTPGLTYSSGNDRITLRGIGRLTNNLASEPGVANYSDGIYTSSTVEAGRSPLFVERVEVLRGPQGTLYGRNSIGGAINVISKRPTAAFQGEVRATVANFNRQVYEGYVSGPITQGLRFRLGGTRVRQDEGWFHNVAGGPDEGEIRDESYVEAQIAADLGETVTAWIKVASGAYDNRATPGGRTGGGNLTPIDTALITPGSLSAGSGYGFAFGQNLVALGPMRNSTVFQTGDVTAFSANQVNSVKLDDNRILAAEVNWNMGWAALKYAGGYQHYHYELVSDFDNTAVISYQVPLAPLAVCRFVAGCTPLTVFPGAVSTYEEDKSWWSHELNLTSTGEGPLQWIVGAYLYHEEYRQPFDIALPGQAQLAAPSGAAANPDRTIYYTDQDMEMTSKAAFAQLDWAFAETWKLTAGLRYTKDRKSGYEQGRIFCFGCAASVDPRNLGTLTPALDITASQFSGAVPTGSTLVQNGVVGPAVTDPFSGVRRRGLADDWDAWTGTLGLEWRPGDGTLAYAKYSRGYKAGGFNSGTILPFPETQSEHVDAFELGLKRNWTERLQTNVSAFYYDYQDAQTPISVQPTVGPSRTDFINIPKARSMGIELESIWAPTDALQILFNYAFLDATIREGCCYQDGADVSAVQPGARPVGAAGAVDAYTLLPTRNQDLSGAHLPLSPRNKVTLNGTYSWVFSAGKLTASASYLWRDKVFSSIFDRGYYETPARDQVDLRLTWRDADDRYSLVAYGQNVFDAQDFESQTATRTSTGGLNRSYVLTPPAAWGVQVQHRF